MRTALFGAVAIAAVSTFGDFLWAGLRIPHRVVFGLAHGTILFLSIGAYFGWTARRVGVGAIGGALIGLVAAGSFYVLAPVAGYSVMFAVWAFVWGALAVLVLRVLRVDPLPWSAVATRGAGAMVASGVAFYLISGIWRPFDPQGWDYARHFASWTVAYLPAFALFSVKSRDTLSRNTTT